MALEFPLQVAALLGAIARLLLAEKLDAAWGVSHGALVA